MSIKKEVLIPFLAGLLFGPNPGDLEDLRGLNPLFGGSAFRTICILVFVLIDSLNPLFGGSAFRTACGRRNMRGRSS